MANMVYQYDELRAFKCQNKQLPELGQIIVFAYNYGEARFLAKEYFKKQDEASRYLDIRASIVAKGLNKELAGGICHNENCKGFDLVGKYLEKVE